MKVRLLPSVVSVSNGPGTERSETLSSNMETIEWSPAAPYVERPPAFVYDPHATGLGAGLAQGWTTPRTPLAYREVSEARSVGQRLIVNRSGEIILDEIIATEEACAVQMARFADRSTSLFYEDTDIVAINGEYESARLDTPQIRIEEPVLSLMSIEPSNYGSWLFRIIPKLMFADRLGGAQLKIACWSPAPWQKDMLAFFGISEDRIININLGACYEFRKIYVPVVVNPFAYLNEETVSFYKKNLHSHGIVAKRERAIFLSRQTRAAAADFRNVRHFVDELQMIEAMRALGFEIIEPETMSIRQQAELFSSAAIVVGASGAGMFNTVFCAPGTVIVDIEAFPHWLYAHCNYFSSCGHTYAIAFGQVDANDDAAPHKRWTISIPGLLSRIQMMRSIADDR